LRRFERDKNLVAGQIVSREEECSSMLLKSRLTKRYSICHNTVGTSLVTLSCSDIHSALVERLSMRGVSMRP